MEKSGGVLLMEGATFQRCLFNRGFTVACMVPFSQTSTWTANYNRARGVSAQGRTDNALFERVRNGNTPFRTVKREWVLSGIPVAALCTLACILENM